VFGLDSGFRVRARVRVAQHDQVLGLAAEEEVEEVRRRWRRVAGWRWRRWVVVVG
jgi:hypothetical protein